MAGTFESASEAPIALEISGSVATVWLDRPAAHNTIDRKTAAALRAVAFDLEANENVRVVILRGRGRQFCAGGDIAMFGENLNGIGRFIQDVIADFHDALLAFRRMGKPTIAVVHGAAAGGGLSLALACDFVIAEESTKFSVAYRRLGAATDGGMTHLLAALLGQRRAVELLLASDVFSAAQALAMNLVNRVVPAADLEAEIDCLVRKLAENAPASVAALKRLVYQAPAATYDEQLHREMTAFVQCAATDDFREGVTAFLERRPPAFIGR